MLGGIAKWAAVCEPFGAGSGSSASAFGSAAGAASGAAPPLLLPPPEPPAVLSGRGPEDAAKDAAVSLVAVGSPVVLAFFSDPAQKIAQKPVTVATRVKANGSAAVPREILFPPAAVVHGTKGENALGWGMVVLSGPSRTRELSTATTGVGRGDWLGCRSAASSATAGHGVARLTGVLATALQPPATARQSGACS